MSMRQAVADHVAKDVQDARSDVATKAAEFANAALDLGELFALDELNMALKQARAERNGAKETTAPPPEGAELSKGSKRNG